MAASRWRARPEELSRAGAANGGASKDKIAARIGPHGARRAWALLARARDKLRADKYYYNYWTAFLPRTHSHFGWLGVLGGLVNGLLPLPPPPPTVAH